jgi:hypothetical protein
MAACSTRTAFFQACPVKRNPIRLEHYNLVIGCQLLELAFLNLRPQTGMCLAEGVDALAFYARVSASSDLAQILARACFVGFEFHGFSLKKPSAI